MKKILVFTILLLGISNLQAQVRELLIKPTISVRDTVFNNVILIKDADITTNGYDFLIDIPIKSQKEPIVISYNDWRIPAKLFFDRKSFLSDQDEILLITFDWEFYKEIREREKRTGLHIKAARQKIYHIQRNNTGFKVDSLSVSAHDPFKPIKFNFIKPELQKDEVKYYYQDCYGSGCCPHDTKRDIYPIIQNKIKLFEEKNNLNVTHNVLTISLGEEGERCIYYPLSDLTNDQKLQFFQIFKEADKIDNKIYVPIVCATK